MSHLADSCIHLLLSLRTLRATHRSDGTMDLRLSHWFGASWECILVMLLAVYRLL